MRYSTDFRQKAALLGDKELLRHIEDGSVFLVAHQLYTGMTWYKNLEPKTVIRLMQREKGLLVLIQTVRAYPERPKTFYEEFYLTSTFTPWVIAEYIQVGKEHIVLQLAIQLDAQEKDRLDLLEQWRAEISGRVYKPALLSKIKVDTTQPMPRFSANDLVVLREVRVDDDGRQERVIHNVSQQEIEGDEDSALYQTFLGMAFIEKPPE